VLVLLYVPTPNVVSFPNLIECGLLSQSDNANLFVCNWNVCCTRLWGILFLQFRFNFSQINMGRLDISSFHNIKWTNVDNENYKDIYSKLVKIKHFTSTFFDFLLLIFNQLYCFYRWSFVRWSFRPEEFSFKIV